MNYFKIRNRFWQSQLSKPLSTSAIAMYDYLMQRCNYSGWPHWFELSSKLIQRDIRISRDTLRAARQSLAEEGFIQFQKGGPGRTPLYHIVGVGESLPNNQNIPVATETAVPAPLDFQPIQSEVPNNPGKETLPPPLPGENYKEKLKEMIASAKTERYRKSMESILANHPYISRHMRPLTEDEFYILLKKFGEPCVVRTIRNLENSRTYRERYVALFPTLLSWCPRTTT